MTLPRLLRAPTALACQSYREVTEQGAFALLLLGVVGACAVSPLLTLFAFESGESLLLDLGCSTVLLGGALSAGLAASLSLGAEGERGTLQLVLAKPLSPATLLVGKFLGVLAAAGLVHLAASLALLLAVRQGPALGAQDPTDWPVVVALLGCGPMAALLAAARSRRSPRSFAGLWSSSLLALLLLAWVCVGFLGPGGELRPFSGGSSRLILGLTLGFCALPILAAAACVGATRPSLGGWGGAAAVFLVGLVLGGESPAALLWLPDLQVFWSAEAFYRQDAAPSPLYLLEGLLYGAGVALTILGVGSWLLEGQEAG